MVILTTNSFRDPLFYGTVITYMREINKQMKYDLHVVSFEQDLYAAKGETAIQLRNELSGLNITHYPLPWKSGGLFTKNAEYKRAYHTVKNICDLHDVKLITALANVAGTYAWKIARKLKKKCFVFTYEPHSEFLADCGVWNKNGLRYRVLHHFEKKIGMYSDYIGTGTKYMVERLTLWKTQAKVYRIPSCIDEDKFIFSKEARNRHRDALGLGSRKTFIYLGKFGDLYYREEIIDLFNSILKNIPEAFLIVLTPNSKEEIAAMFRKRNISTANYFIGHATPDEVPGWISAADIGIIAVPPLPSQKFRSPIKAGEYLCCGIPYIVCKGVSEDDLVAQQNDCGVVLTDFSEASLAKEMHQLHELLAEEREVQRTRCRKAGIDYRSKSIAINAFNEIFDDVYGRS